MFLSSVEEAVRNLFNWICLERDNPNLTQRDILNTAVLSNKLQGLCLHTVA